MAQQLVGDPVVGNGRVQGLLSLPNVAEVPRSEWARHTVHERMVARDRVPLLVEDGLASDGLLALLDSGGSPGLVLAGERLAGVLSLTDLARALDEQRPRRP